MSGTEITCKLTAHIRRILFSFFLNAYVEKLLCNLRVRVFLLSLVSLRIRPGGDGPAHPEYSNPAWEFGRGETGVITSSIILP